MGLFRQYDHPSFLEAIDRVQQVAEKHGKSTGVFIPNMGEYDKYRHRGFQFIGCGSDTVFIMQGAQGMVEEMRQKLIT
jgi:2-keto-3-deoxy-L-rhamnonate aldolase RhmA